VLAIASRVLIYGLLAISLDFIMGYAGLFSFGHATYFGAGAYVTGILALNGVSSGFLTFPAAIAASAIIALAVGAVTLRTRGIYFIMITFAFAQMLFYFVVGQQSFGGSDGMALAHRSNFGTLVNLASPSDLYYFAGALVASTLYMLHRIVRSRFGLLLMACRQNETRLLSAGSATYSYKLVAFVIAGAFAGLAGALIANLEAYISPHFLDWRTSGILIMMIILGGIGTLYGPLVGAAVYIGFETIVTPYTTHWMAVLGLLLMLVASFWREGIWGRIGASRTANRVPRSSAYQDGWSGRAIGQRISRMVKSHSP